MQKSAITAVPVHELIQERWSPRAFNGAPISKETLTKLFEAARWASSRFNSQPWRFIVASNDDAEAFEKLASCLFDGNYAWASKSSAIVAVIASLKGKPDSDPNPAFMYDVGLAVGQLVLEATANDLVVHQMAGIDRGKIKERFNVPDDHAIICCLAIGEIGEAANLSETLQEREAAPRARKPLSEFVFSGDWNQAADL